MAQWRISDRWLAVGLLTVAYFSAYLISWHKTEGARLREEAQIVELRNEKSRQAKGKRREKTEDDVLLDWLIPLTQSPDWDIRDAAAAIVFHRFAANEECLARLRSKLKDKQGDAEEKAHLEALRDMAHARFDLYIPRSQSPRLFNIDRARQIGADLMASPVTLEDAAQSAQRTLALVDQIAASLQLTSADSSPVFSPDEVATFDGTRTFERADELDAENEDEMDTPNEDESIALLSELPMDERNADEVHTEDDSYQQLFDEETQRRRQRREAIAIGNLEDGLEIYEPIVEGDAHERTATELIESMRGLGGQVQGLLDTLEEIQPSP